MSFGLPKGQGEGSLTYGGYLKIRELVSLQELLTDPPQHDEMLFIIIHQVYELWFKELLHEIDSVISMLYRDEILSAHRLVRRCIEIERVLVGQIAVLETITPTDFLNFRDNLMPASGFQSMQFRELEIVSGLKDERFLLNYEPDSDQYSRLKARMGRPTLRDAFYDLLRRQGLNVPEATAATAAPAVPGPDGAGTQRLAALARLFEEADLHYGLFLLAEGLIEYDETFTLWRFRHVKMVERMIGSKVGTGGSEGAAYLRKTVDRQFFPELWELRSLLSKKSGGY